MLISSGSTIAYSFLGTKSSPSCLYEKWNNSSFYIQRKQINPLLLFTFNRNIPTNNVHVNWHSTVGFGSGLMYFGCIHHSRIIPLLSSLCEEIEYIFPQFLDLFHIVDNVQWIFFLVLLWTLYNVNCIVSLNDNRGKEDKKKIHRMSKHQLIFNLDWMAPKLLGCIP